MESLKDKINHNWEETLEHTYDDKTREVINSKFEEIQHDIKEAVQKLMTYEKVILLSARKIGNKIGSENQVLRLQRIKEIFGDLED